ncbi:MAG: glycine cleavage system protein GcvH [Pseudomonadota bacterium]
MSAPLPENLLYTEGHSWLSQGEDGLLTIGITEYGQSLLGDLVFVQLPEVGARCAEGDTLATVESVKSAWDVLAPLEVVVTEVNDTLSDAPEQINEAPYTAGWIVRCSPSAELPSLMDAAAYKDFIGE